MKLCQTNQPTDGRTDRQGHKEVSLPIIVSLNGEDEIFSLPVFYYVKEST